MSQINSVPAFVAPSPSITSPRARIRPIAVEPTKAELVERPRKRRIALFKQADVARAISAAKKAGFVPGSVEVTKDGTIRIYAAGTEPSISLFDQWADKL